MTKTARMTAALLLLAVGTATPAQERPEAAQQKRPQAAPKEREKAPLIERLQTPRYEEFDLGEGLYIMRGDVAVRIRGYEIRCDALLAWLADPSAAGEEESANPLGRYVKEVYAEGSFVFKDGTRTVLADRLFLDLENERGLALNGRAAYRVRRQGEESRLVVRAEELRLIGPDRLEALGARVFQSPFSVPTWYLSSERIDVDLWPLQSEREERPVFRYRASGNELRAGDLTLLPLPPLDGDTASGGLGRYIDDLRFGRTSRFGLRVEPVLGGDIRTEDGRRWGRWRALGAWLSRRGLGVGLELDYATDEYAGHFLSRYQNDTGEDRPFGKPETEDRGRVHWWHRHQLPAEVQLDLELNLLSDRGFFPIYYEREYRDLKPPENILFAKRRWFNGQISGLVQARFNDWTPTTESLPEIRYDLISEPLFDIAGQRLYLDTSLRIGRKRRRPDADARLFEAPGAAWRADLDTVLTLPISAGPLTISPFAGIRTTYYSRDLQGDDLVRAGGLSGVSIASRLWRDFDVVSEFFNINGLRHAIYPVLTVRNLAGTGFEPTTLARYDDVEDIDDGTEFELQLRNILQTTEEVDDGFRMATLFDLDLRQTYYPDRDDNFGRHFGNLDADILVRITPSVQLHTDFEVNYYGRDLEVFNISLGYVPDRDFQALIGFRKFQDVYAAAFGQLWWRVEQKYLVVAETAWDFEDGEGISHRLRLSRLGAEWVITVNFQADVQEGDYGFGLAISPRLLFDPRRGINDLGGDPRLRFPGGRLTR